MMTVLSAIGWWLVFFLVVSVVYFCITPEPNNNNLEIDRIDAELRGKR